MTKLQNSGFTLLELLFVMLIGGILIGLASPSFYTIILDNRIATRANNLILALNTARSEAINRGIRVTVCKSQNGSTCQTSGQWEDGWMVFSDPSGIGTYDSATERRILVAEGFTTTATLRASVDFANFISYLPSGFSHDDGSFQLCDDRGTSKMRTITISLTGRVKIDKGGVSCP